MCLCKLNKLSRFHFVFTPSTVPRKSHDVVYSSSVGMAKSAKFVVPKKCGNVSSGRSAPGMEPYKVDDIDENVRQQRQHQRDKSAEETEKRPDRMLSGISYAEGSDNSTSPGPSHPPSSPGIAKLMRTPLGLLLPPPSTESRFRSHRQRDHLSPEVDEEEEEPSLAYTLVAGAMAGVISKTAVAPLERAKIYFMTNEQDKFRLRRMVKWLKLSYRGEVRTSHLLFYYPTKLVHQ